MTHIQTQTAKAEQFRAQHHAGKLLMLPNIWDSLGARLIAKAGFPSIATASVATALSNGYTDGEKIPFSELMQVVKKITSAVELPVTVDIERGFSDNIPQLKDNIRMLLENGAVGINIEDSYPDHKSLYKIEEQCRKIEAIRETGMQYGVPIVINARTDIFLLNTEENPLPKAIERGRAFHSAGADCLYPITMNNYDDIARYLEEAFMPVNVLLQKQVSDLNVWRKSVSPG
jgi:2-methylisocitrate lyase-like PEP mutase family enzyme